MAGNFVRRVDRMRLHQDLTIAARIFENALTSAELDGGAYDDMEGHLRQTAGLIAEQCINYLEAKDGEQADTGDSAYPDDTGS